MADHEGVREGEGGREGGGGGGREGEERGREREYLRVPSQRQEAQLHDGVRRAMASLITKA